MFFPDTWAAMMHMPKALDMGITQLGRLWRAAKAGVFLELIWLLREPGVDVNWRHAGERTEALHAACSFGQVQAVSVLLGTLALSHDASASSHAYLRRRRHRSQCRRLSRS